MNLKSTVPQTLAIRPYKTEDASATLAIFTSAITTTAAADYSPEQIQAWARPGQREVGRWDASMQKRNSFVVATSGEVIGFSDVDEHGYIDMMFVAPEHQGRGVARALLGEAERRAREFGATDLAADVSITARPFFESRGFVTEQRQEPIRQGVKLVNFRMRKSLRSPDV